MFIVLVKRVATLTRCHDYNVVRSIQSSESGGTRFGSYFQCKDRSKSLPSLAKELFATVVTLTSGSSVRARMIHRGDAKVLIGD
jgi:hypothetical protein